MEELEAYRQSLASKLETRSQSLMLDEGQVKELIDLKAKQNPTEQDKARIKELSETERAKDEELKKLQTTATLTEPQKARLTELTNLQQKSKTVGGQLEKDYNDQLETKRQDMIAKAEADIRDAIAKIAEAQGFTFVLAKDAALYGGADITDKVMDKLDRKVQ
jgi:Skp family chaperone for outer membrane proteins